MMTQMTVCVCGMTHTHTHIMIPRPHPALSVPMLNISSDVFTGEPCVAPPRGLSADGAPACAKMTAYPSHVHHLTGVARQADNIIQLAILACLAAAVAGLAAIYACFR